jgi:subtilisin-like proprotein convertase family protein
MKIFRNLTGNGLLLAALLFGTGGEHHPLLFADSSRGNDGDMTSQPTGFLQEQEACKESFVEQEIPDDGSWLTVCWNDPSAPLESAVIKTHVKYVVDHPDLSQLEVQLVHDGVPEPLILWDGRGQAEEFGNTIGLETFAGSPGAGNWYLQVRDIVAGDSGKLTGMTIHNTYFLEGLMPVPEGVEGVEPSAMRLPPDAIPSSAPDLDPPKIEIESLQDIKSETFEGSFPNAN